MEFGVLGLDVDLRPPLLGALGHVHNCVGGATPWLPLAGMTGEYPSQVVAHTGRPDWNGGIASSTQAASAALGVVRVAGL